MIKRMRKKVTENYISWCRFVRKKHNLRWGHISEHCTIWISFAGKCGSFFSKYCSVCLTLTPTHCWELMKSVGMLWWLVNTIDVAVEVLLTCVWLSHFLSFGFISSFLWGWISLLPVC
jgi:hypothetical protein